MNDTLQRIKIDGRDFVIVASMQDFRAEDSFIHRKNKLARYKGNGESKKHVGTYKGSLSNNMSTFFGYSNWGLEHFDENKKRKTFSSAKARGAIISEGTCFFSKTNLLKYLQEAKTEYFQQEQNYQNDIHRFYEERLKKVSRLSSELLAFSIYDASDNLSQKQNRGYIRSDDAIWRLWRELILPGISYLSILKIVPADRPIKTTAPAFYFRILLDYQFRSYIHPHSMEEQSLLSQRQSQRRANRLGAEKYRREVINYMAQCPFTHISDERLLIASHIKPYSISIKENREDEALDFLNGLALSPTYDKLFDQGYITFKNNGELVCGTLLSRYTWGKLGINTNAINRMNIRPEGREGYLEYHRNEVFQDNINDCL